MEEFIPGQRWFSNAELQMGLGHIVSVDHRTVTIAFEASGETRIYAKQNAPLTRMIFSEGKEITLVDDQCLKVISVSEKKGLLSYTGVTQSGNTVTLEEGQLNHFIQLNQPAERLFSGQIDKNRWFELRYQTLQEVNQLTHSELSGLTGCRTSLIPHQLFIAHEVANRYAPRVLLADEVGLGKTIEAGLILHHQLINERSQRVLIIVPESLLHQWLVEMLRRFNLMFSIFDEQRCHATYAENENLFLDEQRVLCSLEFLAKNDLYYQQALQGEWDILVVDEAHHLQWTPEKSSHEYQLVEQLTQKIRGILLLTATPEQLGIESHFARLRLLDPDRFPDLDTFIAEDKEYQAIAHAMDALLSDQPLDSASQSILKTIFNEEQKFSEEFNTTNDSNKKTLIDHLLDRHGTGRVLFRNTRTAVKGFPGRSVFAHRQKLPDEYRQILDQFTHHFSSNEAFTSQGSKQNLAQKKSQDFSKLVLFPELLYQIKSPNSKEPSDWTRIDPRVKWLGNWLFTQKEVDNKILVIAANAQTAIDIASALKQQFGIHAAVFHEGLSLVERDRSAAFFADSETGAPILICSEIGSEGRNFQFAHQIVLFDLPLNPDLLEQRIGRLDRIGQTQTIKIHIPYLENTAQSTLFHWYHEGLNAFEQTCPAGHNVFTQVETQLQSVLMSTIPTDDINPDSSVVNALIQQTRTIHQQLNTALHEGRDRLLEYNSCRQPDADRLKSLAEKTEDPTLLFQYMDNVFDALGIDHSEHSEHCYIISPSEHMLNQFPGLPDDGLTITYDRSTALANEDLHFFTWDHPMIRTAMDMIGSSEMGNTAMTTLESSKLSISPKPGTVLLECLFVLETTAHETLQAHRYLPQTILRFMIDEQGHDLTQHIHHHEMQQNQEVINTQTAQQIIKVKEESVQLMIEKAENLCEQQTPQLLQSAKDASRKTLCNEINRLKALAQINPNIRQEEIDFFNGQLQSLNTIFQTVKPRLDALRVIIVT